MLENLISELSLSFPYVILAPFFWQAMAATTIIAMMIGAMVCNGDFGRLQRAILEISTYAVLIALTSVTRIYAFTKFEFQVMLKGQGLAGLTTIFLVTVFYFFGLYLGVIAHRLSKRK